ncbi:MAG: CBS domain-containing protein [Thiogranum sp.]
MTDQSIALSSLFSPAQILCGAQGSRVEETARQMIELIAGSDSSIDSEAVYQLVLARKRCGVMLLQPGVAVVHVRINGLQGLRMALATSREGQVCCPDREDYLYAETGSVPANLIVLMLAPADDPASYLRAIAALTAICRRENFVESLSTLDNPELVWKSIEATGVALPEYVAARDIMRSDFARLRDTDGLYAAIDLFCREGVNELPVVDADGDLVGIVSEEELIRLCLPEYITWMEDLSPILNFEPFAEILRREAHMPVMEIMVFADRYATVDEATPAIQVAKVMMRRDVRQVLVVRDKKLMGIISIQDFIQKVLRA